jgi:hypothetical protein
MSYHRDQLLKPNKITFSRTTFCNELHFLVRLFVIDNIFLWEFVSLKTDWSFFHPHQMELTKDNLSYKALL